MATILVSKCTQPVNQLPRWYVEVRAASFSEAHVAADKEAICNGWDAERSEHGLGFDSYGVNTTWAFHYKHKNARNRR